MGIVPRINKNDLFNLFEDGISQGGWNLLRLNGIKDHPRQYLMYMGEAKIRLRVYLWNLSFGGRKSLPDEYRIQITGVTNFERQPGEVCVILGWWQAGGIFAGFDCNHHRGVLGNSPSIQIRLGAMEQAVKRGFGVHTKDNNEIAVAVRPDLLSLYVSNLADIHACGELPREVSLLKKIAENPGSVTDEEIVEQASGPRKYALVETRKALREGNFRARILNAYRGQCAICGTQLDLVDAAHILPVAHEKSTDETCNGVLLCALHHRAYDRSLITFDDAYRIQVNATRFALLKKIGQAFGLEAFQAALPKQLLVLPEENGEQPAKKYILLANSMRGW